MDNSVTTGFTDVPANKYYTGAVKWADDNNILDAYTSTTFQPSTALTREMAANALINYCEEYNVKTYVYFHPTKNSQKWNEQLINVPKLIAHEVFHTLGFGHIDYVIHYSVINTGDSVYFENITHLQQYDYLCLKSKYSID